MFLGLSHNIHLFREGDTTSFLFCFGFFFGRKIWIYIFEPTLVGVCTTRLRFRGEG